MATLALAAAGAAAGSALLPSGLSLLGASISGATIGAQVGALAGSLVDQSLFAAAGPSRAVQGPRLSDLHVMASTEGAPIPRVYGRARIGGQVIWASEFEEEVVSTDAGGGGKGGSGGGTATQTTYRYFANFAVALCEGEIAGMGRIWADNNELDLSAFSYRLHHGGELQEADSLLVARLGPDAPAFRGTAYVVFERLAIAPFGNRLPQLSFEVFRGTSELARLVRGVVLIPGSGEFFPATQEVTRVGFAGERVAENVHTTTGLTDATLSLDQLQAQLPNVETVSLVASWFGTDLRCGQCQILPKVEIAQKETALLVWSVAGLTRATAPVVTTHDGRAAYGGTPSDGTLIECIRDLAERGLSVTLNPFVLMDIAAGNSLPNPLDGTASQPAYPWRGRITCDPAPGRPGTPDKTTAAAIQVAAFIGSAQPSHFSLAGDTVIYSGPTEWSYRRFVLHYAMLAKAAGGVATFLIGSELRGMTTLRSGAAIYPFVAGLQQLAADVRSILGPAVKITYAADWSEYFGHQPADGTGDVHFHLDPLWTSPAIDAIGIDAYWPLADWREGDTHLDRNGGAHSPYALDYLKGNLVGGEGFDWYYASAADREAQNRTPITDALGKAWMFRFKDVKSWWLNPHFDRNGGVEATLPTAWVPQSKPIWFMEVGCGAVDKAANQPNVFADPKSSESRLPYFSNGQRDDFMQSRYLRAFLEAFDADSEAAVAGANPLSTVYGAAMIDVGRTHVYAWDLRPYPAFPADTSTWGDGSAWRLGHWLNGRATSLTLNGAVSQLADDFGLEPLDAETLEGVVPGYVVDRIMSARDAMQPLELASFIDSIESDGRIRMQHRGTTGVAAEILEPDLVEVRPDMAPLTTVRSLEGDLPARAKITFVAGEGDYRQAVVEARRLSGSSARVAQAELPLILDSDDAQGLAQSWLFEAWSARERMSFTLPPSRLSIEPGDVVRVVTEAGSRLVRITEIADHGARAIEAKSFDPTVYRRAMQPERPRPMPPAVVSGAPEVEFLDLPLLTGDEPATAGYVAAAQTPWPGALAIYRSPETAGFTLQGLIEAGSIFAQTLDILPPGPEGRFDRANTVRVAVAPEARLASISMLALLAGGNLAAVRASAQTWELVQFETAELIGAGIYRLKNLLRGQSGTETAMTALPAGARVILLGPALKRLDLNAADIGLPFTWRIGAANRDLGSAAYGDVTHAFSGIGARPLSPVHLRGRRSGGDLSISWIRRTRTGGDSWSASEVPLAEDFEAYEVEIMAGPVVKRTLTTSAPQALYTAAQQIADFGSLQPLVDVRVSQMSAVWGRGTQRGGSI